MTNVRLVFIRNNQGADHDDNIKISSIDNCPEMFNIAYMSPEYRKERRFMACYSSALQYIEDILVSLEYDTEPFELVQLMTAVHPSVLIHVADLSDNSVRRLLMNQIRDAMRFNITAVEE